MNKLKDLLAARAAAIESADKLAQLDESALTAEQIEANGLDFDRLAAEIKALDGKIARVQVVENAKSATPIVVTPAPVGIDPSTPAAAGPQPSTEFESIAEFMATVAINPNDQRLASMWRPHYGAATTQSTTTTRGGYAIPPAFWNTMLQIGAQSEVIRPRATVLPVNTEAPEQTLHIPALDQSDHAESPTVPKVFGGAAVSWIAEGVEKPQTDFKIREVTLTPYEVAASLDVTDRLLRNWRAAGSVIENLLRGAMAAAHDVAFLSGDGSSKPTGIISHASTLSVTRTAPSQFSYVDAVAMLTQLLPGSAAAWIINPTVKQSLLTMKNPNNDYIWQPNAREGEPMSLLGLPILWNYRSPVPGATGDVVLADLSKYLILPGSGPVVAASDQVRFRENITVYKCFWNVDGKPWLTQPFMQEDGLTYSPFVQLV